MRRKIPLLRGLAILAVLIGHAALWGIEPLNPPIGSPLSVDPWTRLQFELLAAVVELSYFSVPAFFFGAGLFATFAVQKPGLRENAAFLVARTKGLLVPLAIWSVVAFGVAWVLGIPSMSAYALNRLALGQVEWGYFFPLAMLQMYLLTPWLVDQARRAPRRLLALGLAVQLLAVAARGLGSMAGVLDVPTLGAGPGNYAIWRWSAYITAGVVAGLHASALERWLKARRRQLLALLAVSTVLMVVEGHVLAAGTLDVGWFASQTRPAVLLFAFAALAAFFAVDFPARPAVRFIEGVGALSFGLFLVHPIGYRILHELFAHFAGTLAETQPLALAPVYLVLGAGPCYWVLSRLFRSRHRAKAALIFGH